MLHQDLIERRDNFISSINSLTTPCPIIVQLLTLQLEAEKVGQKYTENAWLNAIVNLHSVLAPGGRYEGNTLVAETLQLMVVLHKARIRGLNLSSGEKQC